MTNAEAIRYLESLLSDPEKREKTITAIYDNEEVINLIASYDGQELPDYDPLTPEQCYGVGYSPQHRVMIKEGQEIPDPDYNPADDVCGANCPYGLYKPAPTPEEVQGDLSCYLLVLATEVLSLPLASKDFGPIKTNRWRRKLALSLLSALEKIQSMSQERQYVLKPDERLVEHEGNTFVWSNSQNTYLLWEDGTPILGTQVVKEAPPVPPAPPTPALPPAPKPELPPSPSTTPVPPAGSAELPSGIPPRPQDPPAPSREEPPAVASPPTSIQEAPPFEDVKRSEDDPISDDTAIIEKIREFVGSLRKTAMKRIEAVFDDIQEAIVDLLTVRAESQEASDPEKPLPTKSRASIVEESTTEDDTADSDYIQDGESLVDAFARLNANNFAGVDRDAFRQVFLGSATTEDLESMLLERDLDPKKYKGARRATSMKTALVSNIYGNGKTPKA